MATLYWGGGTGTWDGFTATNWYTDLARTVLAGRAPAADDDVVFDSSSNATAYTVTIANSTTVCRDVTISGPASGNLTLAGSGIWYIYGSMTLPATGLTRTFTGQILFYGTGSQTITTNGVTLASIINFLGTGTYTLQDALNNSTSTIQIGATTFDTNGKNLTCGNISSTTPAGTLTLGASTVNATTIGANSPLTINGGTSNITLSSATASIGNVTNYTGNTFYNVTFSSNAVTNCNIYGNNTFNNLTFTTPAAARVSNVVLWGNQTVNGTLTIAGQSSVNRYFLRSDTVGTTRTLTVGTVAALTDVDFRDITVAGTSSPWSGTRLGNCGGNTNITFPAAKTVYWNSTVGGSWEGNFWATGSGGSVSTANFPLAQDTAIIDDAGLNTGSTISGGSGYNLGTLTSTKTNAYTLSTSPIIYGDCTLTASTTTSSFSPTFAGRVTQNLTSAGNTISAFTCNGYNASVKLADNTTIGTWSVVSGGLDTNNKSFTVSTTVSFGTSTPPLSFSLTLGSSSVNLVSFGSNNVLSPTMTVSAGTSAITLTNGTGVIGFAGQNLTWNNVTWSAALVSPQVIGNNTFNNLTLTAPTATSVSNLTLTGNQTISGTLALGGGTSVTQRLGIISNTPGTQRTITAATITGLTDVDFRDIAAAGASAPWSGTRLGDCKGNSGITFPAAKTVYWNLAAPSNWSDTGWATTSTGTPAANNFPLAQDTATFTNAGSADTVIINASWNIGTIDASGRTNSLILAGSGAPNIYGNVTYGSGISLTYSGAFTFLGTSTQTYTTGGQNIPSTTIINNPLCAFRHGDAYTSAVGIILTSGSYTTQNYNVNISALNSSNINTRSITLGTSTVTLSGASNAINFSNSVGLTFSGASSTINFSSTSVKTLQGGGQTFGTVSSTGGTTNPFTIVGNNKFTTLTNSARTFLVFTAGTTQEVTNFTYSGASGSVVRWYTSIPGQQATIKTTSSAVGANSTNGGNNTGLTFTGSSPDYFYVKDIAYSGFGGGGNFFMFFNGM